MSGATTKVHDPKSKGRDPVSNGNALFLEADGRSSWAKRFRSIVEFHVDDLGGKDALTQAQRSLVRRAAAISAALERMENDLADDLTVDLDLYARMTGHLTRVLNTLGIERKSKTITHLDDYLAAKRRAAP